MKIPLHSIRMFKTFLFLLTALLSIQVEGQSYKSVQKNNKWGVVDSKGDTIISCQYLEIKEFTDGLVWAKSSAGWGLVNPKDEVIIPFGYSDCSNFTNGIAAVKKDKTWGIIDLQNNIIIPFIYNEIVAINNQRGSEGFMKLIKVKRRNAYGIIDIKNRPITRFKYRVSSKINFDSQEVIDSIISFADDKYDVVLNRIRHNKDLVVARSSISVTGKPYIKMDDNGKYGIVDSDMNWITEPIYDTICPFNPHFAVARLKNKFGFINDSGEVIGSIEYDDINTNTDYGLGIAKKNGKWGVINAQNDIVCDFVYDIMGNFENDKTWVCISNLYGYINKEGDVIVPIEYNDIGSIVDSIVSVKKNGKCGFYKIGEGIIVDTKYDGVGQFDKNGLSIVILDSKYGFIDKSGIVIIPIIYDAVSIISRGRLWVNIGGTINDNSVIGGLYGLMDITGKALTPVLYDDLQLDCENGRSWVKKNGKYGWISESGKPLTEIVYETTTYPSYDNKNYDIKVVLSNIADLSNDETAQEVYKEATSAELNKKSKSSSKNMIHFNPQEQMLSLRYSLKNGVYSIYTFANISQKNGAKKTRALYFDDFEISSDCGNVVINGNKIKFIGNQWDYALKVYPTKGSIKIKHKNSDYSRNISFSVNPYPSSIVAHSKELDLEILEICPYDDIDICIVNDISTGNINIYKLPLYIDVSGINGKNGVNGEKGKDGSNGLYNIVNLSDKPIIRGVQYAAALANKNSSHRSYYTAGSNGFNGSDGTDGEDGEAGGIVNILISSVDDDIIDKLIINIDGGKGGKGGKGGQGGDGGVGTRNGRPGLKGDDGDDGDDGKSGTKTINTSDELVSSKYLNYIHPYLSGDIIEEIAENKSVSPEIIQEFANLYDRVYSYSNGLAHVIKDGKHGFINNKGEIIIPLNYDLASNFSNGYAIVSNNGINGIVDIKGNYTKIAKQYDQIFPFKNGFAMVMRNNKYGFINKLGIEVIPAIYAKIHKDYYFSWLNNKNAKYKPMYVVENIYNSKKFKWLDFTGNTLPSSSSNSGFTVRDVIPDAIWDF